MKKTDIAYIPKMNADGPVGLERPMTQIEVRSVYRFAERSKLRLDKLRSEIIERFGLLYSDACLVVRHVKEIRQG